MSLETKNYCAEFKPTRLQRITRWLFPYNFCDFPEQDVVNDDLSMRITSELSIADRLRVLISGRIQLEVKVACEGRVGEYTAASTFTALPNKFLDK